MIPLGSFIPLPIRDAEEPLLEVLGGWAEYVHGFDGPTSALSICPAPHPLAPGSGLVGPAHTPPLSPCSIVLSICIFFVPFAFSLLCQHLDGNQTQRGIPLVTSIQKEKYSLCF